jgi:hypothetical protein
LQRKKSESAREIPQFPAIARRCMNYISADFWLDEKANKW